MTHIDQSHQPDMETRHGLPPINMSLLSRLKENVNQAEIVYYRAVFQEVMRPVLVRYQWTIFWDIESSYYCSFCDADGRNINNITVFDMVMKCHSLKLKNSNDDFNTAHMMNLVGANSQIELNGKVYQAWSPMVYKSQQKTDEFYKQWQSGK